MAIKSTPDGVDLKLSNYSTTAAMNGSIALANNATLATVAANYGLKTVVASLLSAVDGLDTPLEVDTKIANALLGLATEAFVAAQLASRDASITALQGAKADATLLASYATNAALSASKTTLQSALDAILAELAALQLSGSGGVVNAPAWAASRLGSSFAEVTSFAPASGGSSLCCAGQRRRHAEHHGRLLLHGGH